VPAFVWAAFYFPGEGRLRAEIERLRAAGEPTSVQDFPAPPVDGRPDAAAWYALASASRPAWDARDIADFDEFPSLAERGRLGDYGAEAGRALAELELVSERLSASRAPRAKWEALWTRVEGLVSSGVPPATVGADELAALRARVAGSLRSLESASQAGVYAPFAPRALLEGIETKGIDATVPDVYEGILTTRELGPAALAALWSGDETLAVRRLTAGFEVAHLHREAPALILALAESVHWSTALDALERASPLLSPRADLGRITDILAAAEPRRGFCAAIRAHRVLALQVHTLARDGTCETARELSPENPVRRVLWRWMSGHEIADLLRHEARILQAAELPAASRPADMVPQDFEGLSRFTSSVLSVHALESSALLAEVDRREERIRLAREVLTRKGAESRVPEAGAR
jgi:hypothetical protein